MEVGIRELRDGLSRHLAAVRRGAEITVTDHGKPAARLVPYDASASGIERFIAPVVLREVQVRAEARGIPVEQLLSELVGLGMERAGDRAPRVRNGISVLAGVPGHVVTDELVAQYRDDL